MIERLKKRNEELNIQRQKTQSILNRAIADLQAIMGAMQENQYWISVLEKERTEGKPNDNS